MIDKVKERRKKIEIRPYKTTLHLFVCEDILRSFTRRNIPTDSPPDVNTDAFIWRRDDCSEVFAFLPEGCKPGVIAHEMYHVVATALRFVGIKTSDEEVWAYPLGELVQTVVDFVHKPRKKRKQKCSTKETVSSISQ